MPWSAKASAPAPPPLIEQSKVTIAGSHKNITFDVDVADTEEKQAYGLMYRRSLPDTQGMIFIFNPPREAVFWMKNTIIPLDMLFISPDRTIGLIVHSATPNSETPLPSQGKVMAVIEIKGGLSKKYGLNIGDKVYSPVFETLSGK